MAKLLYPGLRLSLAGSRRWAYTLDGLHISAKCRSGMQPPDYDRRAQVDVEPLASESGPNAIRSIRFISHNDAS